MNICLLNDSFPPSIDGVSNAVLNYAKIIEEKYGHSIVVTPAYPNVKDDYPFEVIRYHSLDTTKFIGYRFGLPMTLNQLSDFNEKNIDLLHVHCPIASMFLARILRQELKKPIVLTYHTKFDIDIRKAIDSKLLQDLSIKALVDNISFADEVWVVSKGAGDNLKSLGYEGNYLVMPNGCDLEYGKSSDERIQKIKNKYQIKDDIPVLLFVGRMMWYKGIKIIVDALKNLKENNINFQMVFVGNGIDKEEIIKYVKDINIEDKCLFLEAIQDRDELKDIYSCADLFLFPSTFDTNGIVVNEAASSALASILVEESCAAENTIDKRNTFLIKENSDDMTRVLMEIINNKELIKEVGNNALNEIYISWDKAISKANDRYNYLINNYEYKDNSFIEPRIDERLFGVIADLASTLDKTKKTNELISDKINNVLDRWL